MVLPIRDRTPVHRTIMEPRKSIHSVLESKQQQKKSFSDYRRFVRDHYDGYAGALTAVTGLITGHEALAGRLIRPGAFDVQGCKRILDAGCGNGRYSLFLLKNADPDALITGFDFSQKMLLRARQRLSSERVTHAAADLTKLLRRPHIRRRGMRLGSEHRPSAHGSARAGRGDATGRQAPAVVHGRHVHRPGAAGCGTAAPTIANR